MGHNTNYGSQLGSSLGSIFGAALGGGQGGGRSAAYEDFQRKAAADESMADAAFKRRQTAPDAAEMALNELGISGTQRDALMRAVTGQKKPEEVNYLPNGEVNFANSGGATAQDAAIPDQLMKAFLQAQNDYASVAPSNIDQIQKARGQRQENQYVDDIAQGGYKPDLGKALLLSKGKAPFAGNAFNSTDITSGKQAINPIGTSLIGLNSDKGQQALAGAALNYSGINENEAQTEAIRHGMKMDDLEFVRKNSEFDREMDFKNTERERKNAPDNMGFSYDKLPANHKLVYAKNASALTQIDRAIKAIKDRPESLGFINVLGDNISQRRDPDGVSVRSSVAGIGGLKLHDLSGAAISPSESKRLMPLIPTTTDTPESAIKKLEQLKSEYADINSSLETMYSGGKSQNGATSEWQKPDDWDQFLQETGQK